MNYSLCNVTVQIEYLGRDFKILIAKNRKIVRCGNEAQNLHLNNGDTCPMNGDMSALSVEHGCPWKHLTRNESTTLIFPHSFPARVTRCVIDFATKRTKARLCKSERKIVVYARALKNNTWTLVIVETKCPRSISKSVPSNIRKILLVTILSQNKSFRETEQTIINPRHTFLPFDFNPWIIRASVNL